jgi:hypothetical protein
VRNKSPLNMPEAQATKVSLPTPFNTCNKATNPGKLTNKMPSMRINRFTTNKAVAE